MSVDVFDATRKTQIWTGSLEATLDGPDLTSEDAKRMVTEILKKFPDRGQK
jgi:hypothetical protein